MTATISRSSVWANHAQTPITQLPRNWGVISFMAALHGLALIALLPQCWSWESTAALLILYWVTACLGVTIGYHRVLSHRALRLPPRRCAGQRPRAAGAGRQRSQRAGPGPKLHRNH